MDAGTSPAKVICPPSCPGEQGSRGRCRLLARRHGSSRLPSSGYAAAAAHSGDPVIVCPISRADHAVPASGLQSIWRQASPPANSSELVEIQAAGATSRKSTGWDCASNRRLVRPQRRGSPADCVSAKSRVALSVIMRRGGLGRSPARSETATAAERTCSRPEASSRSVLTSCCVPNHATADRIMYQEPTPIGVSQMQAHLRLKRPTGRVAATSRRLGFSSWACPASCPE